MPGGKGAMTNSALVFSRGRKIHRYDKIHLFRPCNDHIYFAAGRTTETFVFRTADGARVRAGVEICFDLRFPELARMMALQGMVILFVPARWPKKRDDAWRTLLKARAIENQIFVVGCNAVGEEGGNSYVFDPSGEELLSTSGDPGVPSHTVEIDLGRIAHARRLHRNLEEAVLLRRLAGKRK
jgi:predicted amidohydrolase